MAYNFNGLDNEPELKKIALSIGEVAKATVAHYINDANVHAYDVKVDGKVVFTTTLMNMATKLADEIADGEVEYED